MRIAQTGKYEQGACVCEYALHVSMYDAALEAAFLGAIFCARSHAARERVGALVARHGLVLLY